MNKYEVWFNEVFPELEINPPGSIYADTAYFLYHYVKENKPKNILEFGSGLSTAVLGRVTQDYGASIHSLEHHEGYLDAAKQTCEKSGFMNSDIIFAPITKHSFGQREFEVHDPSKIPDKKYDFVFIDAPQGFRPEHPGRAGTFFTAYPFLNDNCTILLDDSDREGERNAVLEWLINFGEEINATYLRFEKPAFLIKFTKNKTYL